MANRSQRWAAMATKSQRRALLVGGVIAIPLAATDIVLVLKRMFPDSVAVNYVGPALSIVGVVMFLRYVTRHP